MKRLLLLCFLFVGFALSTFTVAQTYIHLEETSGTDNAYLISDVASLTFTATDLNLNETSGVTAYVMDDIQKIIFNDIPPSVGIQETNPHATEVYPNPNAGVFTLNVNDGKNGNYRVNVYDVTGSLLSTVSHLQNGSMSNETINISEFGPGIYFLKISNDKEISTKKILVN